MQKYKSLMRNITGSQITCFWKSTFKQCILTINQYKEWSFDTICKAQLSDENKILMDKSMLQRYRKYKCCVFIDFEYMYELDLFMTLPAVTGDLLLSNPELSQCSIFLSFMRAVCSPLYKYYVGWTHYLLWRKWIHFDGELSHISSLIGNVPLYSTVPACRFCCFPMIAVAWIDFHFEHQAL